MTDAAANRARLVHLAITAAQATADRIELEKRVGQTWDTEELQRDFVVEAFAAPYVVVTRKSDNKRGTLRFQHSPRFYFEWREDR